MPASTSLHRPAHLSSPLLRAAWCVAWGRDFATSIIQHLEMRIFSLIAAISLICAGAPAASQTVVVGDVVKVDGKAYRLWGIDALEPQQQCADGWAGGAAAKLSLYELVRDHQVACQPKGTDHNGRIIAVCHADGVDLGAAMISLGLARAHTRDNSDYVEREASAKAAKLGIHKHDCIKAWQWLEQQAEPVQRSSR